MTSYKDLDSCYGKIIYKDFEMIIHKDSGYINATKLCNLVHKEFKQWLRLKSTKEVFGIESKLLSIPKNKLIFKENRAINKLRGTYVHRHLLNIILEWASPTFAVFASEALEEWRNSSKINDHKYMDTISKIDDHDDSCIYESDIRDKLSAELDGEVEVHCKTGIIDIVTDDYIIEVKRLINWKHAVGQIICYHSDTDFISKKKRIHLFSDKPEDECDILTIINDTCADLDIMVTYEQY